MKKSASQQAYCFLEVAGAVSCYYWFRLRILFGFDKTGKKTDY
jgi:hypothetical protein